MKTTVEIPDALLREAKNYAARRGMTLKEVLETGLRQVLESKRPARPFKLKRRTFKGRGSPMEGDWPRIRELIYEGRGGVGDRG